jgi:hypothetical protein
MTMRGLMFVSVLAVTSAALPALAGFVPVSTSYSLDAQARVEATTYALTDLRTVSLTSPQMLDANVAFNEFRTATARLRVIANDAGTEQMARYVGGLSGTADSTRISSSTWVQGRHDGPLFTEAGISREVDATARVRFEFIVDEITPYRFTGLPGGQSASGPFDGLPISDVTIAFWAPAGALHEFHNIDFQRSPSGGFDVTGVLTPGLFPPTTRTPRCSTLSFSPCPDRVRSCLSHSLHLQARAVNATDDYLRRSSFTPRSSSSTRHARAAGSPRSVNVPDSAR